MSRKRTFTMLVSAFIILLSACNLPITTPVGGTNLDPAGGTAMVQTQVANLVASTDAADTAVANALAETLVAMPTNTLEFTFTPSLTFTPSATFTMTFTPTPTFTFTPNIPMVSVSANTNCRTGPGEPYDLVDILPVGKNAEVIGRAADGGSWIIRLPNNPAKTCWLWSQYATVVGNWQALPIVIPPPTPTPSASFSVIYSSTTVCGGVYAIKFRITNNGSTTWESNRSVVTDNDTGVTKTVSRNDFPLFNLCVVASVDQNLDPGEVGLTTSAGFPANPAGHSLTATIRVCSQDGMAGVCQEKTISFTP